MFQQCKTLLLTVSYCVTTLLQQSAVVNGFTATTLRLRRMSTSGGDTPLLMVAIHSSSDNFFDESHNSHNNNDDDDSSSSSFQHRYSTGSRHAQHDTYNNKTKFVTGDELHRLRHQVLALRLELQEARRSLNLYSQIIDTEVVDDEDDYDDAVEYRHTKHYHQQRVHELEQAIMKTQQVDAEFVYFVSLERQELAEREGDFQLASRYYEAAMEARAAIPQFQLEGLWVGKYSDDGYEMINVTYQGDILLAQKVTGTKNVPKGEATFQVDLSPKLGGTLGLPQQQHQHSVWLSPIELGDSAAKQWGCRYLPRFAGSGQVAAEGYQDSQWVDGQLIIVNEFFSFAWLPIGHQVFFGRPTPELILKLMKDEKRKEVGDCSARAFLEKCWEETEHIEDDFLLQHKQDDNDSSTDEDHVVSAPDRSYYYCEGGFFQ